MLDYMFVHGTPYKSIAIFFGALSITAIRGYPAHLFGPTGGVGGDHGILLTRSGVLLLYCIVLHSSTSVRENVQNQYHGLPLGD